MDYNQEPVVYCNTCLSLKIKKLDNINMLFCCDCGNNHIIETDIHTWEELYKKEYGEYYIKKQKST